MPYKVMSLAALKSICAELVWDKLQSSFPPSFKKPREVSLWKSKSDWLSSFEDENKDETIEVLVSGVAQGEANIKIFISALIQAKHPSKHYVARYGIEDCWNGRLSNDLLLPEGNLVLDQVCLGNFYRASCLADQILSDEDSKLVKGIIRDYVIKNKINLAMELNTSLGDARLKALAEDIFGDLTVTNKDRESFKINSKSSSRFF